MCGDTRVVVWFLLGIQIFGMHPWTRRETLQKERRIVIKC